MLVFERSLVVFCTSLSLLTIVTDPGDTNLEYKQILTEREYREQQEINGFGSFIAQSGAEAVRTLLSQVDLEAEFAQLEEELEDASGDILTGRLSGIVNHHVPGYLRTNQLPSYETNCIEDWEEKLAKIIDETEYENMTLISGIPPWIQMYFDWLIERHPGKKIKDIFPNLSIIVYGGVNFEPYRKKLFESIGKEIDTVETYPASEGFFAYQDKQKDNGLLLNTNSGIFFEFVPLEEFFEDNPRRISLKDVELGVNYALIINSNAGLWGYSIGDTIKFIDKNPYRILVTGRVKHFISAFGEHVIGEEVEKAMNKTLEKHPAIITEFTVAPYVETPEGILPHHEWYIEFVEVPAKLFG